MNSFKVLLPDGSVITEQTKINRNGKLFVIDSEKALCELIKRIWMKETGSKSFTDWAKALNEDENYEGEFTKYDALDNLSSMFQINIDGQHVHASEFFDKFLPFKTN